MLGMTPISQEKRRRRDMKINPNISSLPKLVQPTKVPQHDQIVEQSRKWIAQTFYGTLLKQLRNSPFKSELFSGGRGGEAFGSLYDQQLADRMSRGVGNKLCLLYTS